MDFNIKQYRELKKYDAKNGTSNLVISRINNTPAITIKKYNSNTGALLNNVEEIGIDVDVLNAKVLELQDQIDTINEIITDIESIEK